MTRTNRTTTWLLPWLLLASCTLARADEPAAKKPAARSASAEATKKPRVTISKETTFITEPLDKDGNVDYVAALNRHFSQGITTENNAAVLFWQAMGPNGIDAEVREPLFRALGMTPPADKGDYFIPLEAYFNALDFIEQAKFKNDGNSFNDWWQKPLEQAQKTPWSPENSPLIARWLAVNEKPLDLLVTASQRPRWFTPFFREKDGLMLGADPGTSRFRDIARGFVARAMLRAGSGKIDEAWSDLLAAHRLARLASQGSTIIDCLVAMVVDSIACQGDMALLQHCQIDAKRAGRMLADLDGLPTWHSVNEKINWSERFAYLDYVGMAARGDEVISKMVKRDQRPYFLTGLKFVDWDLVLRDGGELWDQLAAAMKQPVPVERRIAVNDFIEHVRQLEDKRWRDNAAFFIAVLDNPQQAFSRYWSLVMFNVSLATAFTVDAELKALAFFDVTRTAFALAAFRADHGDYPTKLADLSPKYMQTVPPDILAESAGAELRYKPEKDGYVLYSIGLNGVDDGGKSYDDRQDNQEGGYFVDWDDMTARVPAAPQKKQAKD